MLSAKDLQAIQTDLSSIAGDAEQSITYRRYIGSAGGDPVLGIPPTDQTTDEATSAEVRELTIEEIQISAGVYKVGDLEFGVRRSAVDARDSVIYQGITWAPVEIRQVALGGTVFKWRLRCKRG